MCGPSRPVPKGKFKCFYKHWSKMTRDWTDRERLEAAKTPPAWTTQPSKVTREDLFNEVDLLKHRLVELDVMFDSVVAARVTRIRSLAATLCPKQPEFVCGFEYENGVQCGIAKRSQAALLEHRRTVHQEDV